MAYKVNLMFHMRGINACLPRFRAEASVNVADFRLEVRARNRFYHFTPQFIFLDDNGRLRYSPQLLKEIRGFIGWLPYFNKRWALAIDKVEFKRFCSANSLATPESWMEPSQAARDFLIKPKNLSFARGLRGPFRKSDADSQLRLNPGEYCEQFIVGTIAKAWYWNETPVALELRKMPTVTGNGVDPIVRLATPPAGSLFGLPLEHAEVEALVRFQGFELDTVLPAGKTALADYRYGSPLYPITAKNLNVLPEQLETRIGKQLVDAGPVFWRGIPEDIRPSTLYTIDAIVDGDDRVWFLEMNCNPMVHPDVYFPMFETLFGPAEAAAAASPPPVVFPLQAALGGWVPGPGPGHPPIPSVTAPAPSGYVPT